MPGLFEELLQPDFFEALPGAASLEADLDRAFSEISRGVILSCHVCSSLLKDISNLEPRSPF